MKDIMKSLVNKVIKPIYLYIPRVLDKLSTMIYTYIYTPDQSYSALFVYIYIRQKSLSIRGQL